MAIPKGYGFPIEFGTAFEQKLLLMGDVGPAIKYNPDRNAIKEQRLDFDPATGEGTGLPLWVATVTDPGEPKGKRASFEITFVARHQPIPAGDEIAPGIWFIELEGLTAHPKVMGQGEFKYLGYTFRATGIKGDTSGSKQAPSDPGAARPTGKAA
ncbi:hypothetical protein ACWEKT_13560 [Nocardia takedensis]